MFNKTMTQPLASLILATIFQYSHNKKTEGFNEYIYKLKMKNETVARSGKINPDLCFLGLHIYRRHITLA